MGVYDKYYNQVRKSQEKSLAEDVAATEKMHDTQKQTVEENYNTQIADTEVSYEDAFKSNDVQRQLNERYLERKAAELGLTDSGMSRTQQTAVQLSHANQRGSLNAQKQKAIDTLAQTMRAKIVEIENSKTASVQQIKSSYDNEARTQATSMTNSYNASQAKTQAAGNSKNNEANRRSDYTRIVTSISNAENESIILSSIYDYVQTYDLDLNEQTFANSEIEPLLTDAGISIDSWKKYYATRNGNKVDIDDGGQETSFTERKWKKVSDTMNGFLWTGNWYNRVDMDDEVEDENGNTYTLQGLSNQGASHEFLQFLTKLRPKDGLQTYTK